MADQARRFAAETFIICLRNRDLSARSSAAVDEKPVLVCVCACACVRRVCVCVCSVFINNYITCSRYSIAIF